MNARLGSAFLSFLDVISCGFGAFTLLFLLLSMLEHKGSDKPSPIKGDKRTAQEQMTVEPQPPGVRPALVQVNIAFKRDEHAEEDLLTFTSSTEQAFTHTRHRNMEVEGHIIQSYHILASTKDKVETDIMNLNNVNYISITHLNGTGVSTKKMKDEFEGNEARITVDATNTNNPVSIAFQ